MSINDHKMVLKLTNVTFRYRNATYTHKCMVKLTENHKKKMLGQNFIIF